MKEGIRAVPSFINLHCHQWHRDVKKFPEEHSILISSLADRDGL